MVGRVLVESGLTTQRSGIDVIYVRTRQLELLLDEERPRNVAPPRIHANGITTATEDLIAPVIEAAFIGFAPEHIYVLFPDEIFRRVQGIKQITGECPSKCGDRVAAQLGKRGD